MLLHLWITFVTPVTPLYHICYTFVSPCITCYTFVSAFNYSLDSLSSIHLSVFVFCILYWVWQCGCGYIRMDPELPSQYSLMATLLLSLCIHFNYFLDPLSCLIILCIHSHISIFCFLYRVWQQSNSVVAPLYLLSIVLYILSHVSTILHPLSIMI